MCQTLNINAVCICPILCGAYVGLSSTNGPVGRWLWGILEDRNQHLHQPDPQAQMSVWSKQDLRNLNSRYLFSFVAYPDFHRDSWYFTGKAEAITTPELFVPGRASTAALCLQNLATWWPKPDHGPSPGVPWVRKVSWEEEIKVRVCVIVPPRDVLTELDEIIHSKHSFCRKCLFFFFFFNTEHERQCAVWKI